MGVAGKWEGCGRGWRAGKLWAWLWSRWTVGVAGMRMSFGRGVGAGCGGYVYNRGSGPYNNKKRWALYRNGSGQWMTEVGAGTGARPRWVWLLV